MRGAAKTQQTTEKYMSQVYRRADDQAHEISPNLQQIIKFSGIFSWQTVVPIAMLTCCVIALGGVHIKYLFSVM